MKEVAWAKLLSCCAMVFALLKNMSYKDIKITTLPKAPMTKSSLLRSFACVMRSPLFDFWRYVQPATLNKFSKPSCSSQRRWGCWRRCLRARRSRKRAFCGPAQFHAQFHEPNLAETQALVSDCRTTWVR